MKNLIDKIVAAEIHRSNSGTRYEILGEFGDRLPKDVQNEIRKRAESDYKEHEKALEKVKKMM
jgi:hypothetical protein